MVHYKAGFTAAFLSLTFLMSVSELIGQSKSRKPPVKKPTAVANAPSEPAPIVIDAPAKIQLKKNERPADTTAADLKRASFIPVYFYEFSQPNFLVKMIYIQHDEAGRGTIVFAKRGPEETIAEPLQLSDATLVRLKARYAALNFFDSAENYQSFRDYKHLGVTTITIKKDRRERSSTFNWTENKDAHELAAEYRKIANQFVWMFDINLARENQPLQAPALIDTLDSLIRRNEIADTQQLLPFLKKLESDERIPLMARNHAAKLSKQIEKSKK